MKSLKESILERFGDHFTKSISIEVEKDPGKIHDIDAFSKITYKELEKVLNITVNEINKSENILTRAVLYYQGNPGWELYHDKYILGKLTCEQSYKILYCISMKYYEYDKLHSCAYYIKDNKIDGLDECIDVMKKIIKYKDENYK